MERCYAEHIEINEKTEKTGKVFSTLEIEQLWNDAEHEKKNQIKKEPHHY